MAHSLDTRRKFFRLLGRGESVLGASKACGINYKTGKNWAKDGRDVVLSYGTAERRRRQRAEKIEAEVVSSATPILDLHLGPRARDCLVDFERFRAAYLGHVSKPWHVEAAQGIIAAIESPDREFLVVNEPPGAGKSTLVHDIAAWVTVRDRRIRGLMGSRTAPKAEMLLRRLRKTLERTTPYRPPAELVERGLACNAEATLAGDYGLFKPLTREDLWRNDAFVVVQAPGDGGSDDKEPTWIAYGLDQDFLGGRFNIAFWDDAIVPRDLKNAELLNELYERWDTEVESRLEPGGMFALVGQRIGANDLSRHCLGKKRPLTEEQQEEIDELEPDERQAVLASLPAFYQHIVFQAHDESKCRGAETHGRGAPPQPDGCLLDPDRLPARDIFAIQANTPDRYATWYQQGDGDPSSSLVKGVWVDGGIDPDEHTLHRGCWDDDRDLMQLPPELVGPHIGIASVDPSPSKFWAVQHWAYTPDADHQLWLLDLLGKRMGGNELLDWSHEEGRFTGVMEEWQKRSVEIGLPIEVWIVEANAAQRFLLQYNHVHRWMSKWGVSIIPHTTSVLKNDEELGVDMVRAWWRHGRIRLPGLRASNVARPSSLRLVTEAKHYPQARTNDQVMAHWFVIKHLDAIAAMHAASTAPVVTLRRPSWARSIPNARPVAVAR